MVLLAASRTSIPFSRPVMHLPQTPPSRERRWLLPERLYRIHHLSRQAVRRISRVFRKRRHRWRRLHPCQVITLRCFDRSSRPGTGLNRCRRWFANCGGIDRPPLRPAAGLICSVIATGHSAADAFSEVNKTSTNPRSYGERFLKCHGLRFLTIASDVMRLASCVSRNTHDRSAVH